MSHPFVFACVTPHGLPILEELSGDEPDLMAKTRHSMQQLGSWMHEAAPDTLIVLTPHGLKIEGMFSVSTSSFMAGEMSEQTVAMMVGDERPDKGVTLHFKRSVDRDLANAMVTGAKAQSIPVAAANFATTQGPFSTLPLDWGAMVPLYFMPNVPIVVITPSRSLSYDDHLAMGRIIAQQVRQSGKRVGLIASCDWSHAHDARGPYGFHENAKALDTQVIELFKTNALEKMTSFSDAFIHHAKPDGIWQTLMLAGAIPEASRKSTFLSYEVPTYFGMMCVAYHAS
ncbi:extradiol dioxygenase [Alicyclobacillus acidoterrestris]|nr:extradiol dioxygenase [Alicyclobacillus acidoterrestris]